MYIIETVYWWPDIPSNSVINCKPQLAYPKCGNWVTTGWTTVRSHKTDLPPVLDYRWNDLVHSVEYKNSQVQLIDTFTYPPLYLSLSLLVQDNAIVVLENGYNLWRFVIDGWIASEPKRAIERVFNNRNSHTFDCSNCNGAILHNGTRWITVTLKYEARTQGGDLLTLYNHDTSVTNTWQTDKKLYGVYKIYSFIHSASSEFLGHWRFHSYNILVPTRNDKEMSISFVASKTNQLCVSITYIAPPLVQSHQALLVLYLGIQGQQEIGRKILLPTDNQWKTVKHVFYVTSGRTYKLAIIPPSSNFQEFAIAEIRACSIREIRVTQISSSAASECTDLKRNVTVNLKPVNTDNQKHGLERWFTTPTHNTPCVKFLPNIRDCRGVTLCSPSACSCAPGYQGPQCDRDCLSGRFGTGCLSSCRHCRNNEPCNHVTGRCTNGCADGWKGPECSKECPAGKYGNMCSKPCGANCKNQKCNHVTGECTDGCGVVWQGTNCLGCNTKYYGAQCRQICSRNCGGDGTCNRNTGHCTNGCIQNWTGYKCDDQKSSTAERSTEGSSGNSGENSNVNGEMSNNGNTDENSNGNVDGNSKEHEIGNSSGNMGWLLLIPLVLMICAMLYWQRKSIRKKYRAFMLQMFPSQGTSANEDSPLSMLRRMRPQTDSPVSTAQVSPALLDIPPPVQPRISIPPPAQLDVPPPLLPRRSLLPPAPAQEKPSVLVPMFDLAQYIEKAVASGQLAAQHALFPRGLTAPSLEAERPEHAGKNRWRNVRPYDASRVVLDPLPRKPHSHYINASYIDGYLKEKAFIATQGPREETIGDFWRLVWQKNISCIIMLCNLTEAQTMKCAQYWPAVNTSAHHKDELLVRTDNEEAFLDYAVRNFTVTRGNASRTVTQLHYTAWPDHGVPRYAHSLASVLRQVPLDGSAPILVHCSAGVGRTGTVILALAGYAMGQAEGVVDMLALLAKMRSQRPNMVDNATQYETAHRVLLELNTLPGCEQPIKDFHAAFRSLQGLGILQTQFWDLSDACRRDILKSNDQYWPKDKNRFPDIVPGTEGRVLLERAGCSYINAVYVDGLRSRDRFVVTQLPLTNTLGDFWLMVWQREAKMVVVLNVPEPTFYLNHVPLWIEGGEQQLPESLKVRHVGAVENSIFDTHHVVLRQQSQKRSKESREVSVLSVNHWRAGELTPHHPDSLVKLWSEMEGAPGTIVLACHDGATASGLTVSAALMLEHLHAAGIVDVASAVRRARRTRPQFITSLTQYEFLHTVALAEIENMDVYVNV